MLRRISFSIGARVTLEPEGFVRGEKGESDEFRVMHIIVSFVNDL